jgi:hypothetical protein
MIGVFTIGTLTLSLFDGTLLKQLYEMLGVKGITTSRIDPSLMENVNATMEL